MAAGSTYEPIATTTLGSATATVTFSSISGSYTDLILVFNGNSDVSSAAFYYRLNSDSTSNYSSTELKTLFNGSPESGRHSNASYMYALGNGFVNDTTVITQFMNYANTTTYKTALTRWNNYDGRVAASVGVWRKTPEAISTIDIYSLNIFTTGSTFTLYGIAAA
jgi:hypothetical protein